MAQQPIPYISDVGVAFQTAIIAAHNQIRGKPLSVVYDQNLTYDTALGKFRAQAQELKTQPQAADPLLIYNRDQLRPHTHLNRRLPTLKAWGAVQPDSSVPLYRMTYSMFNITFMFTTPNPEELEAFEIIYNTHGGIRTVRRIGMTLTATGIAQQFLYTLEWGDLERLDIESGNIYRKGVASAVNVKGWFLISGEPTEYAIQEIDFTTQDINGVTTYTTDVITPSTP